MGRLAKRDVIEDVGGLDAHIKLTGMDRIMLLGHHEERYHEEFAEYGLERVQIIPTEEEES